MPDLLTLSARLESLSEADDGGKPQVRARLVPYGETIEHHGETITFEQGQISVPEKVVPVNLDHGAGALARIGKLHSYTDDDVAMEVTLELSDTTLGRDVLTLLRDSVLTDVSAGIELTEDGGILDHVAIVERGAFGQARNPSRVLEVLHEQKGAVMADTETAPSESPDRILELEGEVEAVRTQLAELSLPAQPKAKPPSLYHFIMADEEERQRIITEFALAQDGTVSAAGVVPDYYTADVIQILDRGRPYVEAIPSDPIGSAGMTIVYPKVTQSPTVGTQGTNGAEADQHTEVDSQQMTIGTVTVDLITYAGANQVARQLMERSQPSFANLLTTQLADQYARSTDAAACAAAVAGVGTEVQLADLSTDAAATQAAFATGAQTIHTASRRRPDSLLVSVDRYAQLQALADTTGRPLLEYPGGAGSNVPGDTSLASTSFGYLGLRGIVDPNAPAGACVMFASDTYSATVEQNPVELRAELVSVLAFEIGVYGLFNHVVKEAGAAYGFRVGA